MCNHALNRKPPSPPMPQKKSGKATFSLILAASTGFLVSGCSSLVLFNPKGPVGAHEKFLILTAFALMLIVVIPVIIMAVWFSRKYRADKTDTVYQPKWSQSVKIELVMWLIPAVIVTCLSVLIWDSTHRLDPYKPLNPNEKQLEIQVVSLDWKWLFIYPEQNIAVINELVFPAKVPLSFRVTSDTVMTSFFIPQLGSQIYGMGGMQTKLHLLADTEGIYDGHNQQFSGTGYAEMNFKAHAVSPEKFDEWVQKVRESSEKLDFKLFQKMAQPSSKEPVAYYSSVEPNLFFSIMGKYNKAMAKGPDSMAMGSEAMHKDNMSSEGN